MRRFDDFWRDEVQLVVFVGDLIVGLSFSGLVAVLGMRPPQVRMHVFPHMLRSEHPYHVSIYSIGALFPTPFPSQHKHKPYSKLVRRFQSVFAIERGIVGPVEIDVLEKSSLFIEREHVSQPFITKDSHSNQISITKSVSTHIHSQKSPLPLDIRILEIDQDLHPQSHMSISLAVHTPTHSVPTSYSPNSHTPHKTYAASSSSQRNNLSTSPHSPPQTPHPRVSGRRASTRVSCRWNNCSG